MGSPGSFTRSDRLVIQRAALLAERLTQDYFGLADDAWTRNPYGIFTIQEVDMSASCPIAFANVVRFEFPSGATDRHSGKGRYGVVLHDPNILLALLRSSCHDLWTLGLFVLTHELTHIVRFRHYDVDFFAAGRDRDNEEATVGAMTREMLAGVTNTDYILDLYESRVRLLAEGANFSNS